LGVRATADHLVVEILCPLLVHAVTKVNHDVVEHGRLDVLGHLSEEEPVSIVALLNDGVDVVAVVGAATVAQEKESAVRRGNRDQAE